LQVKNVAFANAIDQLEKGDRIEEIDSARNFNIYFDF